MDDTKLKEALQKQEEYLFFWGRLEDVPVGDDTFNDLSRDIIEAFRECYGSAYLGKLVFSWDDQKKLERGEIGIYTEYGRQPILPYDCNFVIKHPDAQLEAMVKDWAIDEWPPKFELFTRILQRIKELDGLTLSWR
ncbi:MAG: hypothetical protein IJO56_07825 [Oscillospiraceae bacterium]|nr:hypothetical protein [Oscillospiraceae bacterium]